MRRSVARGAVCVPFSPAIPHGGIVTVETFLPVGSDVTGLIYGSNFLPCCGCLCVFLYLFCGVFFLPAIESEVHCHEVWRGLGDGREFVWAICIFLVAVNS